jgi:uncharacterized small protein (DUF1192 family)
MTLNAVAVELLIDKGGFEPRVALGIAEAIETSMMQAQIVTVPILDARLAQLETKIERTKAELVRWVFLVMLGNVALNAAAAAALNALKH